LAAQERQLGNKFWFTTELHGDFTYHGNEIFEFAGDDDFWVFIGGQLAIDLGGLHPPESTKLELDQFAYSAHKGYTGLVLGNEYSIDIFHAERHTDKSNFHMETNIGIVSVALQLGSSLETHTADSDEDDDLNIAQQAFQSIFGEDFNVMAELWGRSADVSPRCNFRSDVEILHSITDPLELKRELKAFMLSYHPDKIPTNRPQCNKNKHIEKINSQFVVEVTHAKSRLRNLK
jgi:fibro-slime domain-containing protein